MKKQYIKPEIITVSMEPVTLMAVSGESVETLGVLNVHDDKSLPDEVESLSKGHKSIWD